MQSWPLFFNLSAPLASAPRPPWACPSPACSSSATPLPPRPPTPTLQCSTTRTTRTTSGCRLTGGRADPCRRPPAPTLWDRRPWADTHRRWEGGRGHRSDIRKEPQVIFICINNFVQSPILEKHWSGSNKLFFINNFYFYLCCSETSSNLINIPIQLIISFCTFRRSLPRSLSAAAGPRADAGPDRQLLAQDSVAAT